jgi:group I intron endonuclease
MKKQDNDTKTIKIYYLHKGDNIPFYIGKTIKPKIREKQHKFEKGEFIEMVIIEEIKKDEWKYWESYWIEQFKQWGFILENKNKGGGGPLEGTSKPKGFGIGRKQSDSTKQKIGQSNKNNKGPIGVKRNDSTKQKISQANSKPKPQGFGEKIKNNKLNKPNYKSRKPILQYDLEGNFIKEWDSATTIKKELNINNVSIMQCCKKIIKSSHNYVWKYKK